MLDPSYTELMEILNSDDENDQVTSRYTVVIAAAKRARQIIDKGEVNDLKQKPLTRAVMEMYNKKLILK